MVAGSDGALHAQRWEGYARSYLTLGEMADKLIFRKKVAHPFKNFFGDIGAPKFYSNFMQTKQTNKQNKWAQSLHVNETQ